MMMILTRRIWRSCCGWVFCPPVYLPTAGARAAGSVTQAPAINRGRTSHTSLVENMWRVRTGRRIMARRFKRLDSQELQHLGPVPDVTLAMSATCTVSNPQCADREAGSAAAQDVSRVMNSVAHHHAGDCRDTGHHESCWRPARWNALRRWVTLLLCALRDSKAVVQRQEKGQGNVKNGNRYLAWAFIEAAHFACRYCRSQALLRTQKARPTASLPPMRSRTSSRAPATHVEGESALRSEALFRVEIDMASA